MLALLRMPVHDFDFFLLGTAILISLNLVAVFSTEAGNMQAKD
jgi:hypothetical protein